MPSVANVPIKFESASVIVDVTLVTDAELSTIKTMSIRDEHAEAGATGVHDCDESRHLHSEIKHAAALRADYAVENEYGLGKSLYCHLRSVLAAWPWWPGAGIGRNYIPCLSPRDPWHLSKM